MDTLTNCKSKDKNSKCLYCTEDHKSRECPNKTNKELHKCANCNENHASNDRKCNKFIQRLALVMNNIDYNSN